MAENRAIGMIFGMSPTDLEDVIEFEPFTSLRLTLASGDVVELHQREGLSVHGLSLSIEDTTLAGRPRLRMVSIPKIVLLEPLADGFWAARFDGRRWWMTADEMRRVAYQRPFKPFRVKLTSGEMLEIRRSLRTTVAQDRVIFGVHEDATTGAATRMRMVSLNDIAEIEVTSTP